MSADRSLAGGETVGQRLKRLRLERGLSQRELAAPGVSYAYISRIEAGTRQPSVKALRKLAAKLEVSPEYLETGSELDPGEALELRLADLELGVRLGRTEGVAEPLRAILDEAVRAGDPVSARRARIVLADIEQSQGDFAAAVELLEAAVADEGFAPAVHVDVYAQLGRAYAASGQSSRAAALFQRCLDALDGSDPTLEARYATALSYALTDMGDLARAEAVIKRALERTENVEDPYMRVRLYWSLARIAYSEGREADALANTRRAIALLQATEDTLHLARAHLLAARITVARNESADAVRHLDAAAPLLGGSPAAQDAVEMKILRSRIATLEGDAAEGLALADEAAPLASGADEGFAAVARAAALAHMGRHDDADTAYRRAADVLEEHGRWRDAAETCREWGQMLRDAGNEGSALDVLDRAARLGLRVRATEPSAHH